MTLLRIMRTIAASLFIAASSAQAEERKEVDLLLVLAADISRSVDHQEWRLQREGYATAISDPRVVSVMQSGPLRRIGIVYFEWSNTLQQSIVVHWSLIDGIDAARDFSRRLTLGERPFGSGTSIANAIAFGVRLIDYAPFRSQRRIIDISGDGTDNSFRDSFGLELVPSLLENRKRALASNITINGLVILSKEPSLTNSSHTHPPGGLQLYYERNVAGGPGSFVLHADGYPSFAEAIVRKFMREIAAR